MLNIPHLSSVSPDVIEAIGGAMETVLDDHHLEPAEMIAGVLAWYESITVDMGSMDWPEEAAKLAAFVSDIRERLNC